MSRPNNTLCPPPATRFFVGVGNRTCQDGVRAAHCRPRAVNMSRPVCAFSPPVRTNTHARACAHCCAQESGNAGVHALFQQCWANQQDCYSGLLGHLFRECGCCLGGVARRVRWLARIVDCEYSFDGSWVQNFVTEAFFFDMCVAQTG